MYTTHTYIHYNIRTTIVLTTRAHVFVNTLCDGERSRRRVKILRPHQTALRRRPAPDRSGFFFLFFTRTPHSRRVNTPVTRNSKCTPAWRKFKRQINTYKKKKEENEGKKPPELFGSYRPKTRPKSNTDNDRSSRVRLWPIFVAKHF